MDALATFHPVLVAVWCRKFHENSSVIRSYPVDESSVKSGEYCQIASFPNGDSSTVQVAVPDVAILRAPGECDSRQEFFDRMMRTQFLTMDEGLDLQSQIPFALWDRSVALFPNCGKVTVESLSFQQDPGYQCAILEARITELLSGVSDLRKLETDVATYELSEGDVIPVVAESHGQSVYGIAMLHRRNGLTFPCELWTLNAIDLNEEIHLHRRVRTRMLNPDTGELELIEFKALFGRFTPQR